VAYLTNTWTLRGRHVQVGWQSRLHLLYAHENLQHEEIERTSSVLMQTAAAVAIKGAWTQTAMKIAESSTRDHQPLPLHVVNEHVHDRRDDGSETSSNWSAEVSIISKGTDASTNPSHHEADDLPIYYVGTAARKRPKALAEDEPLIDTTAVLAKNSKKTARLEKRQLKKNARKVHSEIKSLLDFPQELLLLILSFVRPSDVVPLLLLNKAMQAFILENERVVAENIMNRHYWVLRQCFPLPVSLEEVPATARPVLTSPQWQDRLRIHKNPYQHIKPINPSTTCTCMSCVLAWNNLNIILDLAHWQKNLESREPIPHIPRGRNPEWNVTLLQEHAEVVDRAMKSPLTYARILEKHLNTTTRTILRFGRWKKKGDKSTVPKPRTYLLTDAEAAAGDDTYLERKGPPSYQPIFMRDNYYNVEAFVPNRKWDQEKQKWFYYSKWPLPHENDLNWLISRFTPRPDPANRQP
jgi:hypothetical protein